MKQLLFNKNETILTAGLICLGAILGVILIYFPGTIFIVVVTLLTALVIWKILPLEDKPFLFKLFAAGMILRITLYFIFIGFLYFSATAGTKYVAENVPQSSRATGISLLFAFPSLVAAMFPWIFGLIKDNTADIWGIGFLFLLAIAAMITAIILLTRDIRKSKTSKKSAT